MSERKLDIVCKTVTLGGRQVELAWDEGTAEDLARFKREVPDSELRAIENADEIGWRYLDWLMADLIAHHAPNQSLSQLRARRRARRRAR